MTEKAKRSITILFISVLMALLGYGSMKLGQSLRAAGSAPPVAQADKYVIIAGVLMMTMVVLAVHELGHLVAGIYQGFRFELFVVGPLGVKRENNQVKIYLNKNLGYYGGVAASSPIDDHPDNARKFANVLLAGPIASVLFAVVCYLIAVMLDIPWSIIFYAGSASSIAIFLATMLPSKTGMFFTDRKRYQRLMKPGKDQEVELAMLRILGKFSKDQSYKNIDPADIDILVADRHNFIRFYGLFNLICTQLENTGVVESSVTTAYETTALKMSKSIVDVFNGEIVKFKEKSLR